MRGLIISGWWSPFSGWGGNNRKRWVDCLPWHILMLYHVTFVLSGSFGWSLLLFFCAWFYLAIELCLGHVVCLALCPFWRDRWTKSFQSLRSFLSSWCLTVPDGTFFPGWFHLSFFFKFWLWPTFQYRYFILLTWPTNCNHFLFVLADSEFQFLFQNCYFDCIPCFHVSCFDLFIYYLLISEFTNLFL